MNRAALTLALTAVGALAQQRTSILMLMLDDYGWANIGFHRNDPVGKREVRTPNMDALAEEGRELDRLYAHKFCSPSRSALQTGRLPIHVNVLNLDASFWNPRNPISGFAAIPRNMTGIAEKLHSAGYATHMVGKWDAGMATADHSPAGRGYDTSTFYFHHQNDYWNQTELTCNGTFVTDYWNNSSPAYGRNSSWACSQTSQQGCEYEDAKFTAAVMSILEAHDPAQPFFLFWAPHSVHVPLQVPQAYLDRFPDIDDPRRRLYAAMTNYIDEAIGACAVQPTINWQLQGSHCTKLQLLRMHTYPGAWS